MAVRGRLIAAATLAMLAAGGCVQVDRLDCGSGDSRCRSEPWAGADQEGPALGWWDAQWSRRLRLAPLPGLITETLQGFAVLVVLDDRRLDYADLGPGGADLRFIAADSAVLAHEIDTWDPQGQSLVWLRLPALGPTTPAVAMYYGNAAAADGASDEVWGPEYAGVWHFDVGAGDQVVDRSGNDFHGTLVNMTAAAAQVDGRRGAGLLFDGVDDYVDFGDQPAFELAAYTWSVWIRADADPLDDRIRQPVWNAEEQFQLNWDHTTPEVIGSVAHRDAAQWADAPLPDVVGAVWYGVAATYDGTALHAYLNGAPAASVPAAAPRPQAGSLIVGGDPGRGWNGRLDELRVANVPRSEAWLQAEHLSMTDALFSYGLPESRP